MKFITKLSLPFLFLLIFQFSAQAQSTEKPNREIGLSFSSFNNFGVVYKIERKNGTYLRFDASSFSLGLANNFKHFNAGLNTRVTMEKRKDLSEKVFFNYGLGFGILGSISHINDPKRTSVNFGPSIHYLLGIQYKISNRAYMGLEISPTLSTQFGYNSQTEDFTYNLNIGASTNAKLGFMYQF